MAQTGLAPASHHYTFPMTGKAARSTSTTLRLPTPHTSTRTSTSLMTHHHPTRPPSTLTACSTTPQVLPPGGQGAALTVRRVQQEAQGSSSPAHRTPNLHFFLAFCFPLGLPFKVEGSAVCR